MRLRTKLIIIFTFLTALPLVALSVILISLVTDAKQADIQKLETQFVELSRAEIKQYVIESTRKILEFEIPGNEPIVLSSCQLKRLLEQVFATNPAIRELSLASVGIYITSASESGGECKELGESNLSQEGTEVLRCHGFPCTLSQAQRNVGALERFTVAASGKSYISDPYFTLSGPMVTVVVPSYNRPENSKDRRVIFVITAELELSPLIKRLSRQPLGQTNYFVLFDAQGRVIAFPRNPEASGKKLASRSSFVREIIESPGAVARASDGAYTGLLGEPVTGAGGGIPELRWAALVEWPHAETNALIEDLRLQIILFVLLAGVVMVTISLFVARGIAGPIQILARGSKEIGQGNFEQKLAVHTGDELEELSDSFNEMAKGLARLDELRKEFVFVATHELRSPVTAIKGYLELIREESTTTLPGVIATSLERIQEANANLVQLVDDLLEIARAEAGRITVEVSPQDVVEAARKVAETLKVLADKRKLTFTQEVPGKVPHVLADRDKLREVLTNLISNAIKYNREGGTVTLRHEVRDGMVVTHVADTGIGMAPEELGHLFEKFWRSRDRAVREITGTGLGLFIVKEIMERMGGKIWAESEKGKGTTFSFSLSSAQEVPQASPKTVTPKKQQKQ